LMSSSIPTGAEGNEQEAQKILERTPTRKPTKIRTVLDAMLLSRLNPRISLKKREILANSENEKLFLTVLPFGVIGVPDQADCRDGEQPIIIDLKVKGKLPREPWFNDKLQPMAYAMDIEVLGFRPPYDLLRCRLSR